MRAQKSQRVTVLALVLLCGMSGALLHGFQVKLRHLFWDHANILPAFQQHYESLIRFGELQWWTDTRSGGAPAYYLNILGHDFLSPLSAASSAIAWLAGNAGIEIRNWIAFYVVYHGGFGHAIFLMGFAAFLSQFVRTRAAMAFGTVVAAFGPTAAAGVYGLGVEQAGYGFLLLASLLRYRQRQDRKSLALLAASGWCVGLSVNHLFLYWLVILLPGFILALQLLDPDARRRPFALFGRMRLPEQVLLVVSCALPLLAVAETYSHGESWLRSTAQTRIYSFEFLRPGNPLQVLLTAVPGIGFQWAPNDSEHLLFGGFGAFTPTSSPDGFLQHNYLGLISAALAIYAVSRVRTVISRTLSAMLAVCVLGIMLSGYSPAFAPFLVLPTPLRAVNHFSDVAFTNGFSLIAIALASIGFDRVRRSTAMRRYLAKSLGALCVCAFAFQIYAYGTAWTSQWIIGFFLVSSLAMMLVLRRTARRSRALGQAPVGILLTLVFLDVSTSSFWWVRSIAAPLTYRAVKAESHSGTGVSTPQDYAEILLVHEAQLKARAMYSGSILAVPEFSLSRRIATMPSDTGARMREIDAGVVHVPATVVSRIRPELQPKRESPDPANRESVTLRRRTNNVLELDVSANSPAVLTWRTLFDGRWQASVNDRVEEVFPAYGVYNAIVVPAGTGIVRFEYAPGRLPWLLALGLLAGTLPWLWLRFGGPSKTTRTST